MLNIFATLVAASLATHAPDPAFYKPVNVNPEGARYENLINLSTSLDIPEFRQISDREVSYEELKHQARHNCKFNSNPSVIENLVRAKRPQWPSASYNSGLSMKKAMEPTGPTQSQRL